MLNGRNLPLSLQWLRSSLLQDLRKRQIAVVQGRFVGGGSGARDEDVKRHTAPHPRSDSGRLANLSTWISIQALSRRTEKMIDSMHMRSAVRCLKSPPSSHLHFTLCLCRCGSDIATEGCNVCAPGNSSSKFASQLVHLWELGLVVSSIFVSIILDRVVTDLIYRWVMLRRTSAPGLLVNP